MRIFVKGGPAVELTQRQFLAKGGEGSIFVKNNVIYKIYEDPKLMIPEGKIRELSVLVDSHIIKPELPILDAKNKLIGYTMKYVKDAIALCLLFTKTYRTANHITPEMMNDLVRKLQALVKYIHQRNILVIDLNELNFLVDQLYKAIYAIDVNSYATKNYPATVIMPNVRDRHSTSFNEGTDWFSFGIVSFQMLTGIHPYQGNHPDFKHLAVNARIDERMKANVSVFHADATWPAACQPFDIIPPALKSWFEAVFEKGVRTPPPDDYAAAIAVIAKVKAIVGSNLFMIEPLGEYDGDVLGVYHSGPTRVVHTTENIYLNKQKIPYANLKLKIAFTTRMGKAIGAYIQNGMVTIVDIISMKDHSLGYGDDLFAYGNRLYIKNGDSILEVVFTEFGDNFIPTTKHIGNVNDLPASTKICDGLVMQNLLGRFFATIFPESGISNQIALPELDGYRLIDAKYENRVLVAIVEKSGEYDRFVFRFSTDHKEYDVRKVEKIVYSGINFTVDDRGVCVLMNEEEEIEAFSAKKDSSTVKTFDDPALDSDMRFYHDGAKVLFVKTERGISKLFSITMRK